MGASDAPVGAADTIVTEAGAAPVPDAFDTRPADARFRVGREIGRGGMGSVVEATDVALDRKVAIKHALSHRAEDLARFEREVRLTAQLEHPSIVPIHEAGRDEDGRPFYVMRRIDGQPLSELVGRAADLSARLAMIPNVLAAIDAAAYAHVRDIIHRDIKPWNILVGAHGATTLIDWGLARRIAPGPDDAVLTDPGSRGDGDGASLTRAGETYGTPGYMAPEQARGEAVDARVDVYALGATLFHVLAGASPAQGQSPAQWIARASEGIEPPIDRLDAAVPRELVTIVAKAMASDARDRYRDAGELASDVRAFLAGKLVAAHHYSAGELAVRFVRRHRLAVSIAVVAVVVLAAMGVLALRSVLRERDRANDERDRASELSERATAERKVAEDRADQLLVVQASTLAVHDPTRAVALLRHLDPDSRHASRARDVAQHAAAQGIAHGVHLPGKQINTVAVSPDNRTLAVAGEDGIIYLVDTASGRVRVLVRSADWISSLVWADDGATIVFNQATSIQAADAATGAVRSLCTGVRGASLWRGPTADAVRFVDDRMHALTEVTTRGRVTVLAEDVNTAAHDGELTLVEQRGRVRLYGRGAVVELAERPKSLFTLLAVSERLGRAAANFDGEIIEWNLDGTLRETWRMNRPGPIMFGREALFVASFEGTVAMLRAHGTVAELGRESPATVMVWSARVHDSGVAFMFNTGSVWLADRAGSRRLPFLRPGSRAFAVGGNVMAAVNGRELRWWNLDHVTPRVYPEIASTWCTSDAKHIYVASRRGLHAIDRASGAARLVGDQDLYQGSLSCTGIHEGTISAVVQGPRRILIDTDTGTVREVDTPLIAGGRRAPFVYALGARLVERARASGSEAVRWIAPDTITWLATGGSYAAVQTRDQLFRVHLTGGTAEPIGAPAKWIGVEPEGRVWIARGTSLSRWDGAEEIAVRTFPSEVQQGHGLADGAMAIQLEDDSWWYVSAGGARQVSSATAKRRTWFNTTGAVLSLDPSSPTLHFLRLASGETITRQFTGVQSAGVADDGTLYALTHGAILAYPDLVPPEPARLRAWIDTATNGHVDRDTDVLVWRRGD